MKGPKVDVNANLAAAKSKGRQVGQATARRAAHSVQNFAPWGFCVPQFEQVIRAVLALGLGR